MAFLPNAHWYSFILIAGATSIAVEIVGVRFLAPLLGSSLPIWGLAIAVVLAGLAWGYGLGGRRAKEPDTFPLVFQYVALACAIFLWMPAVFAIAMYLRDTYFETNNALFIVFAFLLAYSTLLVPSIVFGIVSPLAVQTEADRRQQSAGQVAGRISALSTIGSLVGILLPSFLTIPFLGSQITVWLFAGITLVFSAKVLLNYPRQARTIILLALAGIAVTLLLRRHDASVIFAKETEQQLVRVHQAENMRTLTFDGDLGIQSIMTDAQYTDGYWDYLAGLPVLFPSTPDPLSVLVLGAAASTTERQLDRLWKNTRNFKFTSVELDRELTEIADTYFDPPARHSVHADGRLFTTSNSQIYDLVIIDVYTRELTVPFHLATVEFFEKVDRRLAPQGIVAMNINANSIDTLWMRSIARTAREQFPEIKIVQVPHSCNYLLLASQEPMRLVLAPDEIPASIDPLVPAIENMIEPKYDGILLTDDRSPTDLLGFAALVHSGEAPSCAGQ
jgi:spermidine synthase